MRVMGAWVGNSPQIRIAAPQGSLHICAPGYASDDDATLSRSQLRSKAVSQSKTHAVLSQTLTFTGWSRKRSVGRHMSPSILLVKTYPSSDLLFSV